MSEIYLMTVSLDFPPQRMPGWASACDWLRQAFDPRLQLDVNRDFATQRRAIINGEVDMVYANPFDASLLVRESGFVPLARPAGMHYECIVAVARDAPFHEIEDLRPECRVASTGNPDVNMIGMIMLEPADLDLGNIQLLQMESYPALAEALLRGDADVGFILEAFFDALPAATRQHLRPLAQSRINEISHVLLLGPRLAERAEEARRLLLGMAEDARGRHALDELGFVAWEGMDREVAEYMIDLMDALKA